MVESENLLVQQLVQAASRSWTRLPGRSPSSARLVASPILRRESLALMAANCRRLPTVLDAFFLTWNSTYEQVVIIW